MSLFQKSYRCFAFSSFPKELSDQVKFGGKIFLPVSALEQLARLNIVYPMLFEVKSEEGASTNCGVLEFVAEEGRTYLPDWMMTHLNLRNGDFITIKSKSVPVGRFVKIQPQTENFLEITNPRAVLENGLRNFACLTVGDMISLKYNQKIYQLKVLEAKPTDAICIIEADVEVDFAPPPGYVEPSAKKSEPATETQFDQEMNEDEPQMGFVPFSGGGQRLNGKTVVSHSSINLLSGSGNLPSSNTASDFGRNRSNSSSSLNNSFSRSASPPSANSTRMATSPYGTGNFGKSPSPRQPSPFGNFSPKNAAPLNIPAGKLVFGKVGASPTNSPSKSNLSSSLAAQNQPANGQQTNGNHATNGNAANHQSSQCSPPGSFGFVAFSGQGNSLK